MKRVAKFFKWIKGLFKKEKKPVSVQTIQAINSTITIIHKD